MSARIRFVVVLGLLAASVSQQATAQPPKKEVPSPLPKTVTTAWAKAGAETGWVELTV